MGWTVLYIAFGVVALWLLGEVLLQYKARLRWRLLAFVGFLGVVVGVLIPSVVVIAIGAIAFAIGQTYVTLSFRQGFEKGWALDGIPGVPGLGRGGRERDPGPEGPEPEPVLQVSDLEDIPVSRPEPPTYRPEPLPDDTSEYGVYEEPSPFTPASGGYADPNAGYSAYETYAGYGAQDGQGMHDMQGAGAQGQGYGDGGYGQGQDVYADAAQYGYQDQAYAGYQQDPYAGGYDQQGYDQQPYAQAQYQDPYAGYQQDPYAAGGFGGDHYAADASYGSPQGYAPGADGMEPGGSWVPQQREGDTPPGQQDQPPYPYQQQQGFQPGYDEQYRY